MLELDSAIDGGLFSSFGWIRDLYVRYSAFMRRFRVLGWQRIPVELANETLTWGCLLYTSPSPRDQRGSRMPSSA